MPEVSGFAFAEADDPLCYGDRWVRRMPHFDLCSFAKKGGSMISKVAEIDYVIFAATVAEKVFV